MSHDVIRVFGWEFILLDITFCAVWITLLIRKNYYLQFFFGLFGSVIVFISDYVFFYLIQGTREIFSLPTGLSPLMFLIYFSFTYGMIEFSYVMIMFTLDNWSKKMFWTLLLYSGWFLIAFLPKIFPLSDSTVDIVRHMKENRWTQIGMVVGGYLLLIIFKYTWKPFRSLRWLKLGFLFLTGFLVHFAMEISLLTAGIRPASDLISVLVFNSFIEFNTGVPILFIAWNLINYYMSEKKIRETLISSC
ncbi:MAG: hypothetical protein JW776_12065 [Candidatus Lokiarchaeota archaeon]|nr:hypothetical protein [Candidatus Lokiarchaeota archaeon]